MSEKEEKKAEGGSHPISEAMQTRKEGFYEKIPFTVKQLDVIIWICYIALAVVFVLIALEAAGIYKIG